MMVNVYLSIKSPVGREPEPLILKFTMMQNIG
jgi:hypothetical protein